MQVKRNVLDLEVVRLAQLVDPSLADIAPGSNKVAEDQQLGGHRCPGV
jgi:hypothetical protein